MRKILSILTSTLLIGSLLVGCGSTSETNTSATDTSATSGTATSGTSDTTAAGSATASKGKIVVGASITPHAEILKVAGEVLAKQGYELEVKEFTDYVQPNLALESGEIDANYFQHQPYLDDFNAKNNTHLVSLAAVHYEPFAIYPGKSNDLNNIADGTQIAVPNDATNEARALLLLQAQGFITLKDGVGVEATVKDIAENPHNIKIVEIDAAQLARSLQDVDFAAVNGNYALQAELTVDKDALAVEAADSLAAKTYANILAVKEGDENREDLQALKDALLSQEVKDYINATYNGAVVPSF